MVQSYNKKKELNNIIPKKENIFISVIKIISVIKFYLIDYMSIRNFLYNISFPIFLFHIIILCKKIRRNYETPSD